jgi:hypothetical protein
VYDDDTASLREVDQSDDRDMAALLDHPGSPVSCKTGATRYFSAASQLGIGPRHSVASTPAPVVSNVDGQSRDVNRVQQERAVANGALRFVSQRFSGTGSSLAVREEVVVPVAMTNHGKACLHRKRSLHAQRSDQSGTDGAQGSKEKQSRQDRHCLFCRAKKVANRISRLVGSRDHLETGPRKSKSRG